MRTFKIIAKIKVIKNNKMMCRKECRRQYDRQEYIYIYIYICHHALAARCGVLQFPTGMLLRRVHWCITGSHPPWRSSCVAFPTQKFIKKSIQLASRFMMGFFDGFWNQLGLQGRAKSHRTSIPNRINFLLDFQIDFSIDFALILDAKLGLLDRSCGVLWGPGWVSWWS